MLMSWKSKQVSPCCILVALITHFHFLWAMFWQNHWMRSTTRAKQTSAFFTSMLKMQKRRLYYKWLINASEQYHSKVSYSITSHLTRHEKHVITCWYGNFSKVILSSWNKQTTMHTKFGKLLLMTTVIPRSITSQI